ncbi:hypothetical protein ACIREO_06435 [Streptomyces sp. NPDC102441]|uniref:hypothetical protein n=1 Tax=Streptomyces sp. NPDC102441 TaxID=3366176 RepID=UPI003808E5AF
MSLRPTLRTAVLATVGLGAVLLPSAVAVADSAPTEVPTAEPARESATPTPVPEAGEPTKMSTPAPAKMKPGTVPRGGVAAGERPSQGAGDTALYGSAAGTVLLAGAGVFVLRRRSTAQRNG